MDRLETCVVVDKHEQVLKTSVLCADERTGDVCVYEPPRVQWLVLRRNHRTVHEQARQGRPP
eukprot:1992122-Pleurochrysis_carterae.AAC.4